ncbi:MAG: zinc metallopeptidase [Spirochaetales bacterium]|nr:zinc metallopeptidase [Spirochaetales bacterium]
MYWFQYWWLLVPAIVFGFIAQSMVRSTYSKYSKMGTRGGLTGADLARRILDANGLRQVPVEEVAGKLTDHYDPRSRTLCLSREVGRGRSVAALGIAAHESGHAIQHSRSYVPLAIRNTVYPVASFGSKLGPLIVFAGIIFGIAEPLVTIGIGLFAVAVIFSVLTLPIEFNASSRALRLLGSSGVMTQDELGGARKVLNAAAMTYVASALASVLTLLRLILLSRSR